MQNFRAPFVTVPKEKGDVIRSMVFVLKHVVFFLSRRSLPTLTDAYPPLLRTRKPTAPMRGGRDLYYYVASTDSTDSLEYGCYAVGGLLCGFVAVCCFSPLYLRWPYVVGQGLFSVATYVVS
jgi:hypothetical protein